MLVIARSRPLPPHKDQVQEEIYNLGVCVYGQYQMSSTVLKDMMQTWPEEPHPVPLYGNALPG